MNEGRRATPIPPGSWTGRVPLKLFCAIPTWVSTRN